ncbi:hypothetical protein EGW08_014487 [Elysia chlorotica]|uniref:Uncharacterized protein n=1 Tax=Elysia chlorotica TaxID=188477 RepID=A0A3S1HEM1_ELYCH|nr:hypothetical protein EGW08_014487 [Elysia chlorotica]
MTLSAHHPLPPYRSDQAARDEAWLQLLRSQICLRRVALSFNLFFWITGPGLVGLGVWLYLSLSEFQPIVERQSPAGPAYLILVAGGAAILAGIVGCLGAVNEHRHLLLLARSTVRVSFEQARTSYGEDEASQAGIDKVQSQFSCCGLDRPGDWAPHLPGEWNVTTASPVALPVSCCPRRLTSPGQCTTRSSDLYQQRLPVTRGLVEEKPVNINEILAVMA